MKNKAIFLVLVLQLPLWFCSCAGYTEIENMDILTSHFVYQNEDEIQLGGGIASVRSLSDSMADKPVNYISAKGDTLHEAAQRLQLSADHKLFYGGIRALIIGEEYAKNGIDDFLYYVQSLPEHRTSVSVFTSSASPRELVDYKAVNDFSGGFAAESIVRTLQNDKKMMTCNLSDIGQARAQNKVGFVVPDIEISNDIMRVKGYSIFDKDKKIMQIDALGGNALNYMLSKKAKGSYAFDIAEVGACIVDANMVKKRIDVSESDLGKLYVKASFVFNLTVKNQKASELSDIQREYIKNQTCAVIDNEINSILNTAKATGCDFLMLYKPYQTKNRSRFYDIDWKDMISNMNISTNVETKEVKNDTLR